MRITRREPTFGVMMLPNRPWPRLVELARRYEAEGWNTLWTADHLADQARLDQPWFDGWTVLGAWAQATSTIRLGPLVSSITLRRPVHLALEAASVDAISGGRLELGVGAAGRVPDATMLGLPLWEPAERAGRLDEFVELVNGVLAGTTVEHHGRYYDVAGAVLGSTAVQQPIPLTVAAHGPRTIDLAARVAARWNTFGGPGLDAAGLEDAVRRQCALLDEACERHGRDPSSISRSVLLDFVPEASWSSAAQFEDLVGRYTAIGIDDFVVYDEWDGHVTRQPGAWEQVTGEVIPRLRKG